MKEYFNGWTEKKIEDFCIERLFSGFYRTDNNYGGYVMHFDNGDTYEIRYRYNGFFLIDSTIFVNGELARIYRD